MRGSPFVSGDITSEFLADVRAQHLDRDFAAFNRHRAVDLRNTRRADGNGVHFAEHFLKRSLEAALDLALDVGEGNGWQAILQAQQIVRGIFADEIGPCREGLTQLDRRRADSLERSGIIGLRRLERAEAGEPHQPLDLRRRIGIALDSAQRAVARQCATPFKEPPDMGSWPRHT